MREMVVAEITGELNPSADDLGHRGSAATLPALVDQTSVLTNGERQLLEELLDRLASDGA
jgi:uncharacterized membrane protein YgcG